MLVNFFVDTSVLKSCLLCLLLCIVALLNIFLTSLLNLFYVLFNRRELRSAAPRVLNMIKHSFSTRRSVLPYLKREAQPSVLDMIKHDVRVY